MAHYKSMGFVATLGTLNIVGLNDAKDVALVGAKLSYC